MQPNRSYDIAKDYTNYTLTRQLLIPSNLDLDYNLKNAYFDFFKRSTSISVGDFAFACTDKPK